MGSLGTMELWDGMDKRDQVCVSLTWDWWDVHGIPRHYGTMGRPEVPVDILRQSWTTMELGVRFCSIGNGQEEHTHCLVSSFLTMAQLLQLNT